MNKKLKAIIYEQFGTQADFASAMRMDETIVSRIVRGRRILKPEEAKKWARILDCDPDILKQR